MGCVEQATIFKGVKGAMVRAMTSLAPERIGRAAGSDIDQTGASSLIATSEGQALLRRTSPLALVLQPLSSEPLVASKPTISFKVQRVKLQPINITKLWKCCKVRDLKHLNNTIGN